jgi:hypothetical protein
MWAIRLRLQSQSGYFTTNDLKMLIRVSLKKEGFRIKIIRVQAGLI